MVYQSRNLAYAFFEPFGNLKSIHLYQNKEGQIAWIHSGNKLYRVSHHIGEFKEINLKELKSQYKRIPHNTPFLYEGKLHYYQYYKKSHPTNAWIRHPEIIKKGVWLKQLFPAKENLSLKFFVVRKKIEGLPLVNYVWALYESEQMILFLPAFQNGEQDCNANEYTWRELALEESFYYPGISEKFFLHTEKNELCLRSIEK